jgi:hypothetical protein
MEAFLANLKVILPVIGLDLLKARPRIAEKAVTTEPRTTPLTEHDIAAIASPRFEIRHKSGVRALAAEEDGEFVVLAGSQALKEGTYHSNSYAALKKELIEKGILVPTQPGNGYEFGQPHEFKSPSAAAAVILDRNSNGRYEWKVVGSRLTYHEWQEMKSRPTEGSE